MATLQICRDTITADIVGPAKGGRMMDEKKLSRSCSVLSIGPDGVPVEAVRLLCWATPARSYAAVWVKAPDDYRGGHGMAGGFGYHRQSAAVQEALTAAGFKLSEDIDGRGDSFYPEALAAAARAVGYSGPLYFLQGY